MASTPLHHQYTLNVWSRGKQFCLPESPDVSRDEVEENDGTRTRGKTKLSTFPRDHSLSVLLYIQTIVQQKQTNKEGVRAAIAQLYLGRDLFEFDQGQVTNNQPITAHFVE